MAESAQLDLSHARKVREADFHDRRYNDDPRQTLNGFYRATSASRHRFDELLATIAPGARVLELGCGVTAASFDLAARGCHATAIDISSEAVRQTRQEAAERGVDVDAIVGDAEATGLPAAGFDHVIGNGIIHHLDLDAVAREIDRLLTPDGRALFAEPLGVNPLVNRYRDRTPELRTPDEHPLVPADVTTLELGGRFTVDLEFFTLTQLAVPLVERATSRDLPLGWCRIATRRVDRVLLDRRSPLRWLAWIAVVTMTRTDPAGVRPKA
ncbi:MAG: class I SAM-dependent methyltransferase [Acidimicrobiales bacterium]